MQNDRIKSENLGFIDWFYLVLENTQCCKLGKILRVILTRVMDFSVFITINFRFLKKRNTILLIKLFVFLTHYFVEFMAISSENLKLYLQQFINDKTLFDAIPEIVEAFQHLYLKKNTLLVEEGKVCPYFCFIESGILQHHLMIEGEEKTTYLALKNSATAALKSFIQQIPSRKNIKAISNCDLFVIDLENFQKLLENNKAFYLFYHNLIEHQIYRIDDYRIDLLTLTPEERYKKLLANEPKLLKEVPLQYLASFLGISSRHMSRIRKNIV
jgi:CRP-like cAMP-binding protein